MRKEYETPSAQLNRFSSAEAFASTSTVQVNEVDNEVELDFSI